MPISVANVGPNRAKAWLVTVINPVLEGLARVGYYLDTRNWTWRYRNGWFEILYPAEAFVPIPYHPNLEDLMSAVAPVKVVFRAYEEGLSQLARCCGSAHEQLMGDATFLKEVESHDQAYALDPQVVRREWSREWWGALPREEGPKLVAERVVNRFPGDPYASDARFWATYGDRFLAFREDAAHRMGFAAVDKAGALTRERASDAEKAVIELRRGLGSVYDLPPVPV